MRPPIFVCCLLVATACNGESPSAPTVALNERFTLAPSQRVQIEGAAFQLEFVAVRDDSRCPADVMCVWAGDAIVQVRITDAAQAEYELHAGDAARAAAVHRQVRVELLELQPYPFSSRTIAPADYRATLTVTRP